MILAAGRGERMRPLTDSTPKPLLPAGGKALIVWQIERLAAAGFREIVINIAHLGEKIEEFLGNGGQFGVRIHYSREGQALETAGGIANALHILGKESFLAVNADIFCDYDYKNIRNGLGEDLAHLVLVDNPSHHPTGDFLLDEGRVDDGAGMKLTFSGIGVYHSDLFDGIKGAAKLAPLLRAAMEKRRVSGEYFGGKWVDVGTPQRLAELDCCLKGKK